MTGPFLWALFLASVGSVIGTAIAGRSLDPTELLTGAAVGVAVAIVTPDRA